MFDEEIQSTYNISKDKIPSLKNHAGRISFSRDHAMSTNPINSYFSSDKGYVVRFSVDGTKMSDRYKIRPVRGLVSNSATDDILDTKLPHAKRMPHRGEAEETLFTDKDYVTLKKYIVSIDFLAVNVTLKFKQELKHITESHGYKFGGVHRKWPVIGESYIVDQAIYEMIDKEDTLFEVINK